jgi:hypothetical protein
MSIEAMRQARNAFVWNLSTDLDNIPACEQWANMLRKNIDVLDKALADAERTWVELTDKEIDQGLVRSNYAFQTAGAWRDGVAWATKQLKDKNT